MLSLHQSIKKSQAPAPITPPLTLASSSLKADVAGPNNEALSPDGMTPADAADCNGKISLGNNEKQAPPVTEMAEYSLKIEVIPPSLKLLPNWVQWKRQQNDKDKPTKCPYVAGSQQKAASDNPQTWSSFDAAVTSLNGDRGIWLDASPDRGGVFH